MKRLIIIILFCFSLTSVFAQEDIDGVEKGFTIILSTKDYNAALKTVKGASKKLDLKINLRNYRYDKEYGLDTDVECSCGEEHGYVARGRFDDGDYISIEYSNPYEGFTKDLYMVVIASDKKDSELLKTTLNKAKKHYPDVYTKTTKVSLACMH